MPLSHDIEAILFYYGEPVSFALLGKLLEVSEEEVMEGVKELSLARRDSTLQVIYTDKEVSLGIAGKVREKIEEYEKSEATDTLSQAALETLTAVLYLAPTTKQSVDFIRGVDTSTSLRNLLSRGLVEKERKGSEYRYHGTTKAFSLLGIREATELPEYESLREAYMSYVKESMSE